MTLVTFIIPTIGRKTLLRALESLYKQTVWDWKAVVVFDGMEPTIEVADPRVTVLTCEKKGTHELVNGEQKPNGAGEVRNFGIRNKCDTEWVGFLDDDDTLAHTYLETFYNELKNVYNPDVVLFRMRREHETDVVLPKPEHVSLVRYWVGISFLAKRSVFNDGNWFISSHDEDFNLLERIQTQGYKLVMSPYIKYFVDNHGRAERDGVVGRRIIINPESKTV